MKEVKVNHKYKVTLPDHTADEDFMTHWERERFDSMRDNLKQNMVLFDVGAEQGWQTAVLAQFVGSGNMVIVEPSKEAWPNIRQTWEANGYDKPKGFFRGSFGHRTDFWEPETDWPDCSVGKLQIALGYGTLHQGRQMRLDDYVEKTGIVPDAITIDTEGAELNVLRGSEDTLKRHKPLLWVSVHPDLMTNYNASEDELHEYLKSLGYKGELLATDHEQHWRFYANG